jgi:hypothetical protein
MNSSSRIRTPHFLCALPEIPCVRQASAGDILVVNRAIEPIPGKILVVAVNGEIKVKRLHSGSQGFIQVLGVVTYVIHKVR